MDHAESTAFDHTDNVTDKATYLVDETGKGAHHVR
jgi:hypothetical protein